MKLGLISTSISLAAASLALATAACSGANPLLSGPTQENPDGGATGSSSGGTPAPPHALATIVLGVSHSSGGSTSTPLVLASFVPDAATASACTTSVSGCTVPMLAHCDGTSGNGPICSSGQVCALDASCQPVCQAPCTLQCASGEECYFASPSAQACRKTQTFDAGAITFVGTTTPLTLYPPYSFSETAMGSLFPPGGELTVTASGATGAGFAPFSETFKATTLIQTSPALSTLKASDIFSRGGFSVGWQPGNDKVIISLTGSTGTAECAVNDSAGTFQVPHAVVTAVTGTGTSSLTVSVSRQRVEEKTDGKTLGTLSTATVQPVGYIDLTTISTESFSFQGCAGSQTMCSDGCADLLTSSTDCGSCGNSCGTSYCQNGTCYGTTPTCTGSLTNCGGKCVNLSTSTIDCGYCGNVCPSGQYCSGGVCSTTSSCGSLTTCSDGCQNLQTSSTDCGYCGNSCDGGTCSAGVCSGSTSTCATCETGAESSTCASQYNACAGDANCGNYESCMSGCATGDTTCHSSCQTTYATGASEARNLQSCICNSACPTSCATNSYCTSTL